MFNTFLRPGQGICEFSILSPTTDTGTTGRPVQSEYEPHGSLMGIITVTSPEEREEWKSTGHPVTHKIVQEGPAKDVKPNYILSSNNKNYFVVGIPRNPGGLNRFTIYYCEERTGVK